MLTVDCCVAPDGSLVVACHSGAAGLGQRPDRQGEALQDHLHRPRAPAAGARVAQPGRARCASSSTGRSTRSCSATCCSRRSSRPGSTSGPATASSRSGRGYAVVQMQKATPRFDVPVHSAQLTPDRRTLVLATDPLPAAVHYALTLPGMGRPAKPEPKGDAAAARGRSTSTST